MKLHYEHYGNSENPALVLLHGWGMNSQVWQPLIEPLSRHYHLTLIDLPGQGASRDFPEPYRRDEVIAALLAVAPEKASWIGWSLGGQLALALAAKAPQRVERLVMIASNPCFVQREGWSEGMSAETYQGFADALDLNAAKTLSRFIMLQVQGAEDARASLKQLKAVLAAQQEPASALAQSLALLTEDERCSLAQLSQPLLMLLGAEDQLVPASVAEACKAIRPQTEIRVYAGAAHVPFISHTEVLLADLQEFLQAGAL